MSPFTSLLTTLVGLINTTIMLLLPILAALVILLWIPTLILAFLT